MASARRPLRKEAAPEPVLSRATAQRRRDPLLHIEHHLDGHLGASLGRDARQGLTAEPKTLPAKYFYDERGSRLFEAICDLPEYYLTRTEQALLETVAADLIAEASPTQIVELGSGASRKTRLLLDALTGARPSACYVPVDVSGAMLRQSALAIRGAYPRLRVHGIVGDYERHLAHLPPAERRLLVFLGSTIGNFAPGEAHAFLCGLARTLSPGDFFLLGLDLVKALDILEAAYNDSLGITAAFNRNVLLVLNRELGADFDPARFAHRAFYNREEQQIEMHLVAREAHEVVVPALEMGIRFHELETIRTEISRKFTPASAAAMLGGAGFRLRRWHVSPDRYFALALASLDTPG
jgi:L-histidine N-alpha-methyltransferase